MSERNEQMAAMLMADAPPARDLAFEIAVLARVERRRFHRALVQTAALTLAATVALVLVMPSVAPLGLAGLAAATRMLPPGFSGEQALAILLMAASAALPWWRRAD